LTADHADHLSGTIEAAPRRRRPRDLRPLLRLPVRLSGGDARRQRCRHRPPTRVYKGNPAAFSRPPDATIYLDLDAREAAERAGRTNKFEQDGYLAAVRKNYERLIDAEPDRFVRIDASQSPEAVIARVEEVLSELLGE